MMERGGACMRGGARVMARGGARGELRPGAAGCGQ